MALHSTPSKPMNTTTMRRYNGVRKKNWNLFVSLHFMVLSINGPLMWARRVHSIECNQSVELTHIPFSIENFKCECTVVHWINAAVIVSFITRGHMVSVRIFTLACLCYFIAFRRKFSQVIDTSPRGVLFSLSLSSYVCFPFSLGLGKNAATHTLHAETLFYF